MIIALVVVCVVLALVCFCQRMEIIETQKTMNMQFHRLEQYETWIRGLNTWVGDEINTMKAKKTGVFEIKVGLN